VIAQVLGSNAVTDRLQCVTVWISSDSHVYKYIAACMCTQFLLAKNLTCARPSITLAVADVGDCIHSPLVL
jgi:hypothetical protein